MSAGNSLDRKPVCSLFFVTDLRVEPDEIPEIPSQSREFLLELADQPRCRTEITPSSELLQLLSDRLTAFGAEVRGRPLDGVCGIGQFLCASLEQRGPEIVDLPRGIMDEELGNLGQEFPVTTNPFKQTL